jgi:hypothetical protein
MTREEWAELLKHKARPHFYDDDMFLIGKNGQFISQEVERTYLSYTESIFQYLDPLMQHIAKGGDGGES